MTDTPNTPQPEAREAGGERQTWSSFAASFAKQMAGDGFRRGDLAELRRMDPDAPDAAVFWRLMASRNLLGNPAVEAKWALILHGIALMTPTTGGENRTAHNGIIPVGRALFLGGEVERRESGYYSESRLNRLLTARGPILRRLLARLFRMLAAANQPFNWSEMARFILNDGCNEERAEDIRRGIARAYYQAEHRSAQSPET